MCKWSNLDKDEINEIILNPEKEDELKDGAQEAINDDMNRLSFPSVEIIVRVLGSH